MEEKSLLKFTTAIPFPLLVYKVNVRYNEVRKASGVAYILLDVIEKLRVRKTKYATCFLNSVFREICTIFSEKKFQALSARKYSLTTTIRRIL